MMTLIKSLLSVVLMTMLSVIPSHGKTLAPEQSEILHDCDEMKVYRIYPKWNRTATSDKWLHGYEILKQADVKDKTNRAAVASGIKKIVEQSTGLSAACFEPRHAVVAHKGNHSLECIICFECMQMSCFVDGKKSTGYTITTSASALLDKLVPATPQELRKKGEIAIKHDAPIGHILTAEDLTVRYEEYVPSDAISDPAGAIGKRLVRNADKNDLLTMSSLGLLQYSQPGSTTRMTGDLSNYIEKIQKILVSYPVARNRRLSMTVHKDGRVHWNGESSPAWMVSEKRNGSSDEMWKSFDSANIKFDPLPQWYQEASVRLEIDVPGK